MFKIECSIGLVENDTPKLRYGFINQSHRITFLPEKAAQFPTESAAQAALSEFNDYLESIEAETPFVDCVIVPAN